MSIIDFKMPKIKFKKMKMDVMNELENIDYEKIQKKNSKQRRTTPYEDITNYKTVKEFFLNSVEKYPEEDCILEKPDHKEPYKITTYKEFKEDVIHNMGGMYLIWQCYVELELPFQQIKNYHKTN